MKSILKFFFVFPFFAFIPSTELFSSCVDYNKVISVLKNQQKIVELEMKASKLKNDITSVERGKVALKNLKDKLKVIEDAKKSKSEYEKALKNYESAKAVNEDLEKKAMAIEDELSQTD